MKALRQDGLLEVQAFALFWKSKGFAGELMPDLEPTSSEILCNITMARYCADIQSISLSSRVLLCNAGVDSDAPTLDRLCGLFQQTAQTIWSPVSESVQIVPV